MPEIPFQDLKHAAQAVWQETHASLAESRQRLEDQQSRLKTCGQVISMLKGLPDRPSCDIMLPLGKAAFLPARLTNAERCHVTLGKPAAIASHGQLPCTTRSVCMQGSSCLWLPSASWLGIFCCMCRTAQCEFQPMHAGHGVQMECSRDRAVEILEQQLQSLMEAEQATEEDEQARMLEVSEL